MPWRAPKSSAYFVGISHSFIDIMGSKSKKKSNKCGNRKRKQDKRVEERSKEDGTQSPLQLSLDAFPRHTSELKLEDAVHITGELDFTPKNLCDVGARNPETQVPVVARLYPLNQNELKGRYSEEMLPFPTMMWLTSKELKSRVSQLEVAGCIDSFQKRLDESPTAAQAMRAAHEAYAKERWSLLTADDIKTIKENNGWQESLEMTGVAGMRDFGKVKCLHSHLAHFLARPEHGNVLGAWTNEALTKNADGAKSKEVDAVAEKEAENKIKDEVKAAQVPDSPPAISQNSKQIKAAVEEPKPVKAAMKDPVPTSTPVADTTESTAIVATDDVNVSLGEITSTSEEPLYEHLLEQDQDMKEKKEPKKSCCSSCVVQ